MLYSYLYVLSIFDKAIRAYQDAERIKPDETYPREMITKITSYIEENAIVDVLNRFEPCHAAVVDP